MRAYTVEELDDLRSVVRLKEECGYYAIPEWMTSWYGTPPDECHIEERVRTHMLAGHTAHDLVMSERNRDTMKDQLYRFP